MTGAAFPEATLSDVTVADSRIDLALSSLRGAAFELPYIVELATVWAAELGIGVLDAE